MTRRIFTREEIQANRAPRLTESESRIRGALEALSLSDGYDWEFRDGDGLSDYSVVIFRNGFPLSPEHLLALSRSLVGLTWKVILAQEKSDRAAPEALVEVGPGMLMAFSSDLALRQMVQSANDVLLNEGH